MQSEYGNNEFSNSGRINENGEYEFNIDKNDPDYENLRKRANYKLLNRILPEVEGANFVIPSFDVFEGNGIIRDIRPIFSPKSEKLIRVEYRINHINPYKGFKRIIVRDKGGNGILRYTGVKTLQETLNDFRGRLMDAQELYERMADGIIDQEMKWDGYLEGLGIDTNIAEGRVRAQKTKKE